MSALTNSKSKRIRRMIVRDRQNGRCAICGCDYTGKHLRLLRVVDRADGGEASADNLIGTCDVCADAKSRGEWKPVA